MYLTPEQQALDENTPSEKLRQLAGQSIEHIVTRTKVPDEVLQILLKSSEL